jgi:hypothetical protein
MRNKGKLKNLIFKTQNLEFHLLPVPSLGKNLEYLTRNKKAVLLKGRPACLRATVELAQEGIILKVTPMRFHPLMEMMAISA